MWTMLPLTAGPLWGTSSAKPARRRSITRSTSLSVVAGMVQLTSKPWVLPSTKVGCRATVAVATKPSSFFTLTRS